VVVVVFGPGDGLVGVVFGSAIAAAGAANVAIRATTSATAPRRLAYIPLAVGISTPHLQAIPGFRAAQPGI
jgi:hypothetical protein